MLLELEDQEIDGARSGLYGGWGRAMVYRHKTSPSPRKFEVIASARKALSTIFWDMKGVVHMEFLKQGHTVNSEKYISTLRTLKARLRRVCSGRDSILQHDNARPHTSRQTQDALAQLKLPALPHPAYSPDLAPSISCFSSSRSI